ncbi:MAG TPA: DUF2130 domain-containing protein [Xanthobacteraceae bacterium]|jgi:hypothetical protein
MNTEPLITCPNCGTEIELTEALAAPLHARLEAAHRAELAEIEAKFRREADARLDALVSEAQRKAREDASLDKQILERELADERERRKAAQQAELDLRKQKSALENRARELDLEVARRLDGEKQILEEAIRRSFAEQHDLKLKEKEKLIDDLRRSLDEAKRKSEQGSQERQGEVLELDVEAELARRFPHDVIAPVPKGVRGADLVQEVRDGVRACGVIVWETKNTKHWQAAWLDKLKEDQRALGANLAVLVSTALPDGIVEFGRIEGVWVTSLRAWPALALVLREQLVAVAFAHAAADGKQEKMEFLYHYLAGDAFRSRVTAIVEAFTALRSDLGRERTAMERIWKQREKQIDRVLANTAKMYGEMRGIVGTSLPEVPALELERVAGLIEE